MRAASRRFSIAAILLALLVCVTGTASAPAHPKPWTRLSLKLTRDENLTDTIKLRVWSEKPACAPNRKVRLYHWGVAEQKKDKELFTKLKTNAAGKWKRTATRNENGDRLIEPGVYQYEIKRKTIRAGGGKITCMARKSSKELFTG